MNKELMETDDVIQTGADAGKTEAQLVAEVFNPEVSDLEYFQSRQVALSGKEPKAEERD